MFVLTLGKKSLRRLGAAAVCGIALAGAVLAVSGFIHAGDGALEATHGGLECGLFIEKIPGLDALSMGPELHDVHSVRERLSVPSTERVYRLVCEILKRSK